MTNILDSIDEPKKIQTLTIQQLEQLSYEIRELIITTVSKNGGHLASNLGTVDLTLALYSVFNFPLDKLVWDVGHQAYTHKILTDRRHSFSTLRKKGGLSGFPSRSESIYDPFGDGHASTSISASLGLACSRDIDGHGEHIIAVIGDGALTGGEAFEALNHAGALHKDLIIILNDNGMSIDNNVGAVSEYLSRIRINPQYNKAKNDIKNLLKSIPHIGNTVYKTAEHIKDGVKSALVPGSFFEQIGLKYVGPIDGHNISLMKEVFNEIRSLDGPLLIHVRTKKGKGYLPAEIDPEQFHGIGKFDIITGKAIKLNNTPPFYTTVFSNALIELAKNNPDITAITAAMPSGTGLKKFCEVFPDRYFDVGIAEEHAVTFAAGMAAAGKHPFVAIYSTFLQRAYDQIIHDVCLQNLPVTFCIDRAGLVGADGATHHGVFDLSYLRNIPNMSVMAPKDENELVQMLKLSLKITGPTAIRYPRSVGTGVHISSENPGISLGKAEIIKPDGNIAILAIGSMVETAIESATLLQKNNISAMVVNMRFLKPIDKNCIINLSKKVDLFVTIEENVLAGGFGSAVAEVLLDNMTNTPLLRFGISDKFIPHGTREELLDECNLQSPQIASKILNYLTNKEKVNG